MKMKTRIKAGGMLANHNEGTVRARGVKVRTRVRAGGMLMNHNEPLAAARPREAAGR